MCSGAFLFERLYEYQVLFTHRDSDLVGLGRTYCHILFFVQIGRFVVADRVANRSDFAYPERKGKSARSGLSHNFQSALWYNFIYIRVLWRDDNLSLHDRADGVDRADFMAAASVQRQSLGG